MDDCIIGRNGRPGEYAKSHVLIGPGKTYWLRAHVVAYAMAHGPIPDGMQVCHACDNPPCVNPKHLFLGTAKANAHDRDQKGRRKGPPDRATVGTCRAGLHPWTPDNIIVNDGDARCLQCRREQTRIANRRYRQRKR